MANSVRPPTVPALPLVLRWQEPDAPLPVRPARQRQPREDPHLAPLRFLEEQFGGPLAGMTGIVVRKKSGLRLVLSVELIMKSVAVEIDARDLETLSPAWNTKYGTGSDAEIAEPEVC